MTIILKKGAFSKENYWIDEIHWVEQLWFDRIENDLTGMNRLWKRSRNTCVIIGGIVGFIEQPFHMQTIQTNQLRKESICSIICICIVVEMDSKWENYDIDV